MSVSIETGLTLLAEFRQSLIDNGIEAQSFITGSTAFNGSGNDVDVVVYTQNCTTDLQQYLADNFDHCGEGSYGLAESRSVWVAGKLNVIHVHTADEAKAWSNACLLCVEYVESSGQHIPRELRVRIHQACRGELLV